MQMRSRSVLLQLDVVARRDGFRAGSVVDVVVGETEWVVEDEASFMACYHATLPALFRYAAMLCGADRAAAEDLVQETYLALFRRVQAESLRSVTASYLVTTVRHRFLDDLKRRSREHRRLELVANERPPEVAPTLRRLDELSERERTAVVLRYVDDLPVAAVGRAMSISTRAAESLLARATRRLRGGERRHA